MANAKGNLVSLGYITEVTAGTTPSAPVAYLRNKGATPQADIATTVSNEITTTRDEADLVRTSGKTSLSIPIELSFTEYDPFIQSALGGALSTLVALVATDISAASADNSINSLAAAFSTANILPGHWIKTKGFATAANNGIAKVVSVTTAKIVLSRITLVTEAAGASVTVNGRSVRNGVTAKSFTTETKFTDLTTEFIAQRGMTVNNMTLNASSGAIIEGSFDLMGLSHTVGAATVGNGSFTASSSNPLMSAVANVGTIWINGAATAISFKKIGLSTSNNKRESDAIGSLFPVEIPDGTFTAKFSSDAYFSSSVLLAQFKAGTAGSLSYSFLDSAGNQIVIDAPNVKFDTLSLSGIQKNGDVMQAPAFHALKDATLGYALQISVLPA